MTSALHLPITTFLSTFPSHLLVPHACSLLCPIKTAANCQVLPASQATESWLLLAWLTTTPYPKPLQLMGRALLPFPQLLLFYTTWPCAPLVLCSWLQVPSLALSLLSFFFLPPWPGSVWTLPDTSAELSVISTTINPFSHQCVELRAQSRHSHIGQCPFFEQKLLAAFCYATQYLG